MSGQGTIAGRVYNSNSQAVPAPKALLPYLYHDKTKGGEERHYARVLRSILSDLANDCYDVAHKQRADRILVLLTTAPGSAELPSLILRTVPLGRCTRCGKPFLMESLRRTHCSLRCRSTPDKTTNRKES